MVECFTSARLNPSGTVTVATNLRVYELILKPSTYPGCEGSSIVEVESETLLDSQVMGFSDFYSADALHALWGNMDLTQASRRPVGPLFPPPVQSRLRRAWHRLRTWFSTLLWGDCAKHREAK